MKITIFLFASLVLAGSIFVGCCRSRTEPELSLTARPQGKILIVYYSESKKQNTKTVAEWIHAQVGGEIMAVEMKKPYSESYRDVLKESKHDMESGQKPAIKALALNVADYDIVFVGSPIWYGTFAPPVATFLDGVDLSGKIVVPFCTHGGGGAGTFYKDIAEQCPGAIILDGVAVKGSNVVERTLGRGTKEKVSENEIIQWLNKLPWPQNH